VVLEVVVHIQILLLDSLEMAVQEVQELLFLPGHK
jgi:hypothetical protein